MAEENDATNRRREAKLALGGEKLAEKEKLEDKRRREAILSMEGEAHRARRESREASMQAAVASEKASAEAGAKATAEAQAQTARNAAERARLEEAALNAESERRGKIAQAGARTDALKTSTTKLSSLRTIKTDMARAVKDEGLSLSKIATLQATRARNTGEIVGADDRSRLWVTLSVLVVLLASGGLFYRWWQSQQAIAPAVTAPQPIVKALFPADVDRGIDAATLGSPNQARTALQTLASTVNAQPGLVNLYFYKAAEPLTFAQTVATLGLTLPDNLTRHLRDTFMLGIYDNGEIKNRFLILQTSFFDQAWSAMLDWERYMPSDLAAMLETTSTKQAEWSDRVVRNKDVRVARDSAGNTVMLYGFLDEQTILITRNNETFIKVFERLIDQS
ncbi:MAG: hypothetical protein AAB364_02845 [Patescibacteria group bacterium]